MVTAYCLEFRLKKLVGFKQRVTFYCRISAQVPKSHAANARQVTSSSGKNVRSSGIRGGRILQNADCCVCLLSVAVDSRSAMELISRRRFGRIKFARGHGGSSLHLARRALRKIHRVLGNELRTKSIMVTASNTPTLRLRNEGPRRASASGTFPSFAAALACSSLAAARAAPFRTNNLLTRQLHGKRRLLRRELIRRGGKQRRARFGNGLN